MRKYWVRFLAFLGFRLIALGRTLIDHSPSDIVSLLNRSLAFVPPLPPSTDVRQQGRVSAYEPPPVRSRFCTACDSTVAPHMHTYCCTAKHAP